MAPVLRQEVIKKSIVSIGLLLLLCFAAMQAMNKRTAQENNSLLRDLSFCKASIDDVEIHDWDKKRTEDPSTYIGISTGIGNVSYNITQGEFEATLFTKKNRFVEFCVIFVGNEKKIADYSNEYEGKHLNKINFPILKEVESLLKLKWLTYQNPPFWRKHIFPIANLKAFCDVVIITEE